jgi:4-hydroxybenzoate polyprenyltransferase
MSMVISYLKMIRIEHSLFALPFALSAMILAADGLPPGRTIFWIIFCMVSGRSCAMGINRWADSDIDARNPRTSSREIPAGRISKGAAGAFIIASLMLFILGCAMLNRLTLILSPLPIFIFIIYSFSKRFTVLCHIILGLALGLAPIGAWIAVTGSFTPRIICLGVAVMCWCAGFDIFYALQDVRVDRKQGLYSAPANLGVPMSFFIARTLHVFAFVLFFIHGHIFNMHFLYLVGYLVSVALVLYEHYIVSAHGLKKLDKAFFNMNALISIVLFISTALDAAVY